MQITDWQKKWYDEVNATFPNPMTSEQRLLAIVRQVGDASGALAKKNNALVTDDAKHADSKHRIAAIFIDLFVLCDDEGVVIEHEFGKALEWFKKKRGE